MSIYGIFLTLSWLTHIILVIWCLIDLLRSHLFFGFRRLVMALVIMVFPLVGPFLYIVLRAAEPKQHRPQ